MSAREEKKLVTAEVLEFLKQVPDPRVERTRAHPLENILVIALLAVLCGADSLRVGKSSGSPREPIRSSWRAGGALRSQLCPERGPEPTGTGRDGASVRACRCWRDGNRWSAGDSGQTAAPGAPPKSGTSAGVASGEQRERLRELAPDHRALEARWVAGWGARGPVGGLVEVTQSAADVGGVGDDGAELHRGAAEGAVLEIELEDALHQLGPGAPAAAGATLGGSGCLIRSARRPAEPRARAPPRAASGRPLPLRASPPCCRVHPARTGTRQSPAAPRTPPRRSRG